MAKAKCHLLLGLLSVAGSSSIDSMQLTLTCKMLDMFLNKQNVGYDKYEIEVTYYGTMNESKQKEGNEIEAPS